MDSKESNPRPSPKSFNGDHLPVNPGYLNLRHLTGLERRILRSNKMHTQGPQQNAEGQYRRGTSGPNIHSPNFDFVKIGKGALPCYLT